MHITKNVSKVSTEHFYKLKARDKKYYLSLYVHGEAVSTYQTEGAIFSPQQVGQQTRQGGLIPPAPPGFVEVGRDGQVDVRQKAKEETDTQR